VPAVEALGVIAPVEEFKDNPVVELKVPPVYVPVPINVTGCGVVNELQKNGLPK